jgi:selenocysteine lyase/cysteine desulfurase
MDVKRDNIDFLSADGHKWMLSVEGLGGFYISKNVLEKIYPVTVGWDSVVDAWDFMNYDFTFRPDAKRFEEGSFNTMSIFALGAALDLLEGVGIDSNKSPSNTKLPLCLTGLVLTLSFPRQPSSFERHPRIHIVWV